MNCGEPFEPAWSLSRKHLRAFCPRAALLRYRDAPRGAAPDAPASLQAVFSAAKMVPDGKFIRELLLHTMKRAFCHGCRRASELLPAALRTLEQRFAGIMTGNAAAIPFSAWSEGVPDETAKRRFAAEISARTERIVAAGGWQTLLEIPPECRRILPEVLRINAGDLACFASPLCAATSRGRLLMIELREGDFDDAAMETALLHRLYAANRLGRMPDALDSFVLESRTGELRRFGGEKDHAEALRRISAEIGGWAALAAVPSEEIPGNEGACPQCVFAGICHDR